MRLYALLLLIAITGCATTNDFVHPLNAPHGRETCPACGVGEAPPEAAEAYNRVMRENRQAASTPSKPAAPYPDVTRPAATVAKYRQAIADSLRDPESARFGSTRVVRAESGRDAVCGSVNARNAYGGYTGSDLFYAEMIPVGQGFATVPFFARQVGIEYYAQRCGG